MRTADCLKSWYKGGYTRRSKKVPFVPRSMRVPFAREKEGKKDGLLDAGQAKRQKGIQEDRGSLKHFFAVNF